MIGRRRARVLAVCVLVAFCADAFLSTWTAELLCGVALAVALCCLPERE